MKKVVIEKDNDLLLREEIQKNMDEVMTAVRDELKTWIDHDCFRRYPRRGAVNILDVKMGHDMEVDTKEEQYRRAQFSFALFEHV